MKPETKITGRRGFMKSAVTGGAALVMPSIVSPAALGRGGAAAPSDRVAMGFIGLGGQGAGHVFGEAWTYLPGGYVARKDVRVVAACDVWRERREKVAERVNLYYATLERRKGVAAYCKAHNDFREVLDRDDVDAVLIGSPIHWHAVMSVMAAQAGKDVYCEKPTACTVRESKAVVKAVRENNVVYQAGTQQRSEYEGRFRAACEYVRNGRIGRLTEVYACRPGGGIAWNQPEGDVQPVPEPLDWDLWLGPAPMMPYRGRWDAHLFGFGGINWGQHHYDIVQWTMDADDTGPVEISVEDGHAVYRYESGVTVHGCRYGEETIGDTGGAWFIGTEGKIGVDREHLVSDPPSILEEPLGEDAERVYHSGSHSGNFLVCVRSREKTICAADSSHRAASVMLLGGIAQQLNRTVRWNPETQEIVGDAEAAALLSLPQREPWAV